MKYKKSKYNIYFKENQDEYLYNSFRNSFAKLTKKELDFYKNQLGKGKIDDADIKEENLVLFKQLKKGGYLIEENVNEINYLKAKFMSNERKIESLELTIAPTLNCNFRCPYCYEDSESMSTLSEAEIGKIISFIKKELKEKKKKKLSITWYGGEPLLVTDKINRMSREIIDYCDENEIIYEAGIVTNGYYLTEEIVKKMYFWRIGYVQVTLDGPKEIHNKTRILVNGKGTYDKIIENIKNSCDQLNISVRVNASKVNYLYIEKLLLELKEMGMNKKIGLDIALVDAISEENEGFGKMCLSCNDFSKEKVNMLEKANQLEFNIRPYPRLGGKCSAILKDSLVIAGDGNIYKCWNDVGKEKEAIGNIESIGKYNAHLYDWLAYFPFEEDECLNCNVLPICMGRCPYYKVVKGVKSSCTEYKFNLIETLKLHKSIKTRT